MKPLGMLVVVILSLSFPVRADAAPPPPNVVLVMADDLGWGDTSINGHPVLRTPHIDALARDGVVFERFYAQSPVCSPTRASCLTGLHPYRVGIRGANQGHLPADTVTLQSLLKARGYRTGHFGKWHLGTLTTTVKESNRGGPRGAAHYAPPWERGFDACFSTEAKVPTFDPMVHPETGQPYGTHYWTGPDQPVTTNLDGDDSRVIMDRAVPFIETAVGAGEPFLAVIWFHTPHLPLKAGEADRAPYAKEAMTLQHYYGAVAAMDAQIGRLRARLTELGAADDTLIWFCSDNGPEGARETAKRPGRTGGLRGRKRSLHEGGVRVPGIVAWPAGLDAGRRVEAPASTSDILPTIMNALGDPGALDAGTLDGRSVLPHLRGDVASRGSAIGFVAGKQAAWTGDRWKLITRDRGATWMLFDLAADPAEVRDVSASHSAVFERMRGELLAWLGGVAPGTDWAPQER